MLVLDEPELGHRTGCRVAALSGVLHREALTWFERSLADLLTPARPVVLDVSKVHVPYPPAVGALEKTLLAAGGWPTATLVLVGANGRFTAALRSTGAGRDVVVVDDVAQAFDRLATRPERVRRRLHLRRGTETDPRVRTFLTGLGRDWDVAALALEAQPVAAALVANVARHARTPSILTVALSPEGMRVAVRDFARHAGHPQLAPAGADSGLGLVDRSSREWGVTPRSDGKVVWALLAHTSR